MQLECVIAEKKKQCCFKNHISMYNKCLIYILKYFKVFNVMTELAYYNVILAQDR